MNHKAILTMTVALLALGLFSPATQAQCTIDQATWNTPLYSANPPEGMGQSFTACQTGAVTSITVYAWTAPTAPVTLGLQAGTNMLAPAQTQSVTLSSGFNTITLNTPFPVNNATTYSFSLLPTAGQMGLRSFTGNPYADGTALHTNGNTSTEQPLDLVFTVEISEAAVPVEAVRWGTLKIRP